MKKICFALLLVLSTSSCVTPSLTYKEISYTGVKFSEKTENQEIVVTIKDFYIVGRVFAQINPKEVLGNPKYFHAEPGMLWEALLEKATEIGADDIFNARGFLQKETTSINGVPTTVNVYHGTALAIKYKDALPEPQPQNENAPKARARRSQRTQQN